MKVLPGSCAVIESSNCTEVEGTRRFRRPISIAMGARDLAQTISTYAPGQARARRNPAAEEVLYVVEGSGACVIDGRRYALAIGTGVYIPPAIIYQVENSGEGSLVIVSVCCPEDEVSESSVAPLAVTAQGAAPARTVLEREAEAIPIGDRTFKLLVDGRLGCQRVTQFVGMIPPGRAPMHRHTYEEAIYILAGEGRVWTKQDGAPFTRGASIYLPRGASHCLENTGTDIVRLLGVFYPSGSPAGRY